MVATWILVGVAVIAVLWFVAIFNGFVRDHNIVKEAAAGIDIQLKRRHDLIPKLVDIVKGYMSHERDTLEQVTRLRTQSMATSSLATKGEAEAALTHQLRSVFALAENYPDLKANQNFLELQKTISELEDQIQLSRRYYNGAVRQFNVRIASIPDVFFARVLNYHPAEYFGVSDSDKSDPSINLAQ